MKYAVGVKFHSSRNIVSWTHKHNMGLCCPVIESRKWILVSRVNNSFSHLSCKQFIKKNIFFSFSNNCFAICVFKSNRIRSITMKTCCSIYFSSAKSVCSIRIIVQIINVSTLFLRPRDITYYTYEMGRKHRVQRCNWRCCVYANMSMYACSLWKYINNKVRKCSNAFDRVQCPSYVGFSQYKRNYCHQFICSNVYCTANVNM